MQNKELFQQMREKEFAQVAPFALCPLDGRYSQIALKLAPYFSEYALVENRVYVEVKWLQFLIEYFRNESETLAKHNNSRDLNRILSIYKDFNDVSFMEVKEIEKKTNHDVKAVELYIAEKLRKAELADLVSFIHFGCTSEDINNTAYALMIKGGLKEVWLPAAKELVNRIYSMAERYSHIPMLAHTHGQPATPTTVGKEMEVFDFRLQKVLEQVEAIVSEGICAKFNGATGNYSAISVAYPSEDWIGLSEEFVENYLGLNFNPVTTQIESHDYICELADCIRHFNNILMGMDLDMWLYISMEYFKQLAVESEVGSSTMPHKVNSIRFKNSEANCDISNALLMTLSNKLTKSRMQRDLSDSSAMRNIGMALGYSVQAIEQTIGGLEKVDVNQEKLSQDLNEKWEVLAELIQTVLRKNGIPDAYDQLKALTRGKGITKEAIQEFVKSLEIPEEDKEALLKLTPATYIGLAKEIVERF
jgi:adenylosuccinate lyase